MSATSARFNALVQGIASDTQYVVVTTDEVRASGLLKDRIVISYPEENTGNRDMAVLQAAADEWKLFYCRSIRLRKIVCRKE